jgi:release factor glutamine methyltransferase
VIAPDVLKHAAAELAAAGIDEPGREARLLARAAPDEKTFAANIARRAGREPVAYILGRKEFWSLEFEVTPAVLIPRPESETLIETALAELGVNPPKTILDLGTGSGCLLISLLQEWKLAAGLGVDLSCDAIDVARRNALRHGMGIRALFKVNDWAHDLRQRFDLVVSNPPYIRTRELLSLDRDVADYEPRLALLGGEDGLDPLRRIAAGLETVMQPNGIAIIELGIEQSAAASRILLNSRLEVVKLAKDLAGRERAIVARLPHQPGR